MLKCNFLGRVGKDAELIHGVHGDFVSMDVAENYFYKKENKTRWLRVRCNTPRALKMYKYWTKGRLLDIAGELVDVSIYEDNQGRPSYQLILHAFSIEFGGSNKKKQENTSSSEEPSPVSEADKQATPDMPFDNNDTPDECPF